MTGTEGEIILTRDYSSGTVHKRVRQGDRLLVDERCNLDQAGRYEVVTAEAEGDRCLWCFPSVRHVPEDAA